jgi:hypothetical protein
VLFFFVFGITIFCVYANQFEKEGRYEGKRYEGKRYEGKRYEGKRYEGERYIRRERFEEQKYNMGARYREKW